MPDFPTLLIVIIALALIFDYINGFHDAANAIATIVSTKVLTPFQAVIWAAIFNFVAYFIFKDHGVGETIAKTVKGTVGLEVILSALIAAIIWNLITWWYGIPSSSSHTLIGGFTGAAVAAAGSFDVINTPVMLTIIGFIVIAPFLGMIMAFIISVWFLNSFRKGILPKIIAVLIIAGAGFMLYSKIETNPSKILGIKETEATVQGVQLNDVGSKTPAKTMGLEKGDIVSSIDGTAVSDSKSFDKRLSDHKQGAAIAFNVIRKGEVKAISAIYQPRFESRLTNLIIFGENVKWMLIAFILVALSLFSLFLSKLNYANSERWFKRMQLVSSAAFSIGHGGNDSQKVMGIITVALIAGKQIETFEQMPNWVPLACYTVIALGTMSGGWKIIKTMGTRITKVTPFEGVAAESAGALTLFITEMLKIPVSTTHTITGSIIGVGATKRLSAVRWGVTVNLLWAWIITIPISGIFATIIYYIVHAFLKK
jgi:PiT family inorganic phosphate transporter